ncbi:MAG TPA: MdtA/MuxA family multidrug efflux RND transporter periplasmic adaptor subunit [Pyrinomonadaceae bacterium]|nr:MdtA/MuxA family multidrug efflux RND transporter periplasmic adaptor subunit [Pyrinomonadaceae bacterium]
MNDSTEEKVETGADESAEPARPVSRRRRHAWLWVLLLVLASGFLLFYRHGRAERNPAVIPPSPPAISIVTATAQQGSIGIYVNALGSVTPLTTVTIKSRVDGQLMTVNYREGQSVREGDVLAEIDPRPFETQLTQAEGQLARDQALLNNALVDLERYQTAYSKNAIPKQQLDTQAATVRQYEGTVKNDQGLVDNANLQLVYCRITAPTSGRLGLRLVDPGNIVHATDTNGLLVITQMQPMTVVFSLAEDDLPRIQEQLRRGHRLSVDAFDRTQQKKIATGSLLSLDNQIDTTTGTLKLKAVFPNKDNSLFPNQFVNVRLLVATQNGAILIPTAAIQRNADSAFVYLIKPDQTVAMQNVSVGTTDGDLTAVGGLRPGDTIAVDGFDKLQNGVKVIARQPEKTSSARTTR